MINMKKLMGAYFGQYKAPVSIETVYNIYRESNAKEWEGLYHRPAGQGPIRILAAGQHDAGAYYYSVEVAAIRLIDTDGRNDLANLLGRACGLMLDALLEQDENLSREFICDMRNAVYHRAPSVLLHEILLERRPDVRMYRGVVVQLSDANDSKPNVFEFTCPFRQQVFTFTMRGLSL